ncbi:hypothetical protein ACET3Z_018069 [Daucus carota]
MNIAIKLSRTPAPNSLLFSSSSSSQHFGRSLTAPGGIKFQHSQAKPDKMDQADQPKTKSEHGDAVMKESFGDAYSTRSNDEGFGGIYGGNEEEGGHKVHGVSAEEKEYEKTQGSHVEEKEKARNKK